MQVNNGNPARRSDMSIQSAKALPRLIAICTMLATSAFGAANTSVNPTRAVSLAAISAAMRSGQMTAQAAQLCGITRVAGYVVDEKSHDVVLVGKVDPSAPALHLDDFVVALRSVWMVYSHVSGRTRYYSDPGCSIDPDPRVLAQLRDLNSQGANDYETAARQWRAVGSQPQKVRVMGVPFDSHFAKVMVDADYYMKRLVNGSVALGISGFESLNDKHMNIRRAKARSGAPDDGRSSISRFWFSPGDVTYEDREGLTALTSCPVRLLTEEEFLNSQGSVSGMGRPDPQAAEFARSFSQYYSQIASLRPIYKELQGLFALVGIARLMNEDHCDAVSPDAFRYLLKAYRVATVPVSRAVNGLTDVRKVDEVVDTQQGRSTLTLTQSSCGGVSMSVRPRRVGPAAPKRIATATADTRRSGRPGKASATGKVSKPSKTVSVPRQSGLKHAVLSSRKSPGALSWDVPVQLD
jgi:hypothetical protein